MSNGQGSSGPSRAITRAVLTVIGVGLIGVVVLTFVVWLVQQPERDEEPQPTPSPTVSEPTSED